ncbi:hypothetical protein LCGC14_0392130 [marine sediment metagenome]|uniref:Uncharacterized protein n=1 Tax=marine sediment metagenome TaxID=412755 RepID=A0A0F9T556_9ZZZZ
MRINRKQVKIIDTAEQAFVSGDWFAFDQLLRDHPSIILGHRSSSQATFLHYAVWKKNHVLVKALIKAGADVNWQNNQGYTPLINACAAGDDASAQLLLRAGADTSLRDHMGRDAACFGLLETKPKMKIKRKER